jgi:hypothetical protein
MRGFTESAAVIINDAQTATMLRVARRLGSDADRDSFFKTVADLLRPKAGRRCGYIEAEES